MSLPLLLLVDDSEAVLAFERAALSGHYLLSTATTGREALQKLPQLRPAAVLLDLSMPEMDGDEVLRTMQADPELRAIPVIIVSSEKQRAEECLAGGAKAFLAKPIRAAEVQALVARVLDQARQEQRRGNLAALFVSVGPLELGLPLDSVLQVIHQATTRPLPLGPAYLCELLEIQGQTVPVLDLARRLGVEHTARLEDRKLVVIETDHVRLALCVDDVRDPEELARDDVQPRDQLGGAEHGLLQSALIAVARTPRGPLPIIDPRALLSRTLLHRLAQAVRTVDDAAAVRLPEGPR